MQVIKIMKNNKCVMMSQCNLDPFTIVSQLWMEIFRSLCFHYDVTVAHNYAFRRRKP